MFILGLNGSPRRDGNTAFLVNNALEHIRDEETEVMLLHVDEAVRELEYPFCCFCTIPCNASCYKGTLLEEYFEHLRKADALLVGSPVYFGTVSGQLKGFWDKTLKLRNEKALINTPGGVITVGGARFGGQETTARAVMDMMLIHGMMVLGDGHYEYDAGHLGAMAQQPSSEDNNAIKRARILAERLKQVAG